MRRFITWVFCAGLHCCAMAQPLGDVYWNRILDRADSVVIARFGHAFFMNHIFPPVNDLDHIVIGERSYAWEDRDTITRTPTYCHFEYDLGFDTLHAGRMSILLNITPEDEVIEDEDLRGFVALPAPVTFHTDLNGFVQLAREHGVRCERSSAFRGLYWMPADTALRVQPRGNGSYELILGRIRKKVKETRSSNSTHTYREVDAIVFDPFTGAVLRKEKRRETISISCSGML